MRVLGRAAGSSGRTWFVYEVGRSSEPWLLSPGAHDYFAILDMFAARQDWARRRWPPPKGSLRAFDAKPRRGGADGRGPARGRHRRRPAVPPGPPRRDRARLPDRLARLRPHPPPRPGHHQLVRRLRPRLRLLRRPSRRRPVRDPRRRARPAAPSGRCSPAPATRRGWSTSGRGRRASGTAGTPSAPPATCWTRPPGPASSSRRRCRAPRSCRSESRRRPAGGCRMAIARRRARGGALDGVLGARPIRPPPGSRGPEVQRRRRACVRSSRHAPMTVRQVALRGRRPRGSLAKTEAGSNRSRMTWRASRFAPKVGCPMAGCRLDALATQVARLGRRPQVSRRRIRRATTASGLGRAPRLVEVRFRSVLQRVLPAPSPRRSLAELISSYAR